jgi:DNA mismatch repair ATPase MutS
MVQKEYPANCDVIHDINNNLIMLKSKPSVSTAIEYISPTDRFFKPIAKRYTTKNVEKAVKQYCDITTKGPEIVEKILQNLCAVLTEDMFIIEQIAHWAVILQAVNGHVISSQQKKWILPTLYDKANADTCLKLDGLTPYWLDRNFATSNNIELDGIFLLTAPNMSGKSTLMRSSLVAALLANCGLYVPCNFALVPRYDSFFLRTASYDVPNEQKSAFAVELDDMRIILRDSTKYSLVMIDEF